MIQRHVFISYARDDIDICHGRRLRKLEMLAAVVGNRLGRAFVDELHNVGGSHAEVDAALRSADKFCAIRGARYNRRIWTRWEYARATELGLPVYELTYPELRLTLLRDTGADRPGRLEAA